VGQLALVPKTVVLSKDRGNVDILGRTISTFGFASIEIAETGSNLKGVTETMRRTQTRSKRSGCPQLTVVLNSGQC
jgi:hypothetical protein